MHLQAQIGTRVKLWGSLGFPSTEIEDTQTSLCHRYLQRKLEKWGEALSAWVKIPRIPFLYFRDV